MAQMKSVGFKIVLPLGKETIESKKHLSQQKKELTEMHKKTLPETAKAFKKVGAEAKKSFRDIGEEAEKTGRKTSNAFADALRGIHKFSEGIGKAKDKVINLKNALAATAVGGAAIFGVHKLLEEGKHDLAIKGRLKREFGLEADVIEGAAGTLGRRSGMTNASASAALIPLAEQLQQIEAGSRFRGMKKPLSESQAQALRKKNLEFGSELIGRLSVMAPDMDPTELGRIAGDALSGPEGIRGLLSSFNLSKRSRKLATLNEQGKAFEALSPSERTALGIKKQGQYLEQGDLVRLIMERSGVTMGAADAKRGKLDFQIKSIGAEIENAFGLIGSSALDGFNSKLKKGESIADRFHGFMEQNKSTIEKLGHGLASAAEGVAKFAAYLPRVGAFISEHKTGLMALAGVGATFKGAAWVGGKLSNLKKAKDDIGGLLGKDTVKVWITNPGFGDKGAGSDLSDVAGKVPGKLGKIAGLLGKTVAVAGVGLAAYEATSALDQAIGGTDFLTGTGKHSRIKSKDDAAFEATEALRKKAHDERVARDQARAKAIQEHGSAGAIGGGAAQPQVIQLHLDGRKVAEVVTKHQVHNIRASSALGAAPTVRE